MHDTLIRGVGARVLAKDDFSGFKNFHVDLDLVADPTRVRKCHRLLHDDVAWTRKFSAEKSTDKAVK